MMSNYVFAASEAEMTIKPEENKTANIVNIENIDNNTGVNQVPSTKIYGTTLVNLLGNYGNFENDTNADGLADGWANDAGLTAVANTMDTTYEIFGSKCQKITLSADGEGGNYIEVTISAAQALFVAGYIRAGDTATTGKLIVDWRDNTDTQISTDSVGTNATTTATRKSAVLTAPANTVKARIYITVAGVTGKLAYFDGVEAINLTTQGALDSVRASKYDETNWADLTEAQLEAEIPYFDSVMSVNVEDGTASALTVENRGKNIAPTLSDFKSSIHTYLYDDDRYFNLIDGKLYLDSASSSWDGTNTGLIPINPTKTYNLKFEMTSNDSVVVYMSAYDTSQKRITLPRITASGFSFNCSVFNSICSNNLSGFSKSITFTDTDVAFISIGWGHQSIRTPSGVIWNVQLEEGTSATDYVAPRSDSITIPDTVELHGYAGVFNYIDSNGNYTKYWERADKTTDGAGAFALTGYATGSKVICRNKTNGEVEVLDAAASVTTSWVSAQIEILYRLATAVESTVQLESTGFMVYPGDNNILSPDSKAPAAIQLSGYTGVSSTSSTQAFIERFRANTKRGGRIYQPYGSRTLKSVPTTEEVAISLSKMNIDDETIGLALENTHFQLENTYTNENNGSTITDTYQHCRITSHGKEYSAGDIVKEDVEIECAKVVTS